MKKALFTLVALVLIVCGTVAGTFAWLTAKTDTVKNTFTVGDINIELSESDNLNLKMVPGNTIKKDPKVTVKANSEACWLFVKIEKLNDFDNFMTFEVADEWTELTAGSGIYYREVGANEADQIFEVLKGNIVTVKDTVTKADLEGAKGNNPTLSFTAYAVQKSGFASAAAAWTEANK